MLLLLSVGNVLTGGFQLSAQEQSKRFSVKVDNITLKEAIEVIKKQGNYSFLIRNNDIDLNRKVSVNINNGTINDVMGQLLAGTDVSYEVNGTRVIMFHAVTPQKEQEKAFVLKGRITDPTGEGVIGANVKVVDSTEGTITDMDGNFSLMVTPNARLSISYIGYATQEVVVKDQRPLNVTLKEDTRLIDEVVVVGYGVQKKANLTGAVSSVKMDDVLGDRPVVSVSDALKGAMPGLQITGNSGRPGEEMSFNIRGVNSLDKNGKPLVLVDNVEMDINMLDPNDIESVTVLKDAASSAIYGARAAFGVILITTKKGSDATKLSINYSNNFSFSRPANMPHKATPLQTVQAYKDMGTINYQSGQNVDTWLGLLKEYNANPSAYPDGYAMVDGLRYSLAETDLFDDMMETGFQQTHNISVGGGTKDISYRFSFGMVNENGVLASDKDTYKRYNVSSYLRSDVFSWITPELDIKYTNSNSSLPETSGGYGIWGAAVAFPSYFPTGTMNIDGEELPINTPRNLIDLAYPTTIQKNNLRIFGKVTISPLKNVKLIGEYTFNHLSNEKTKFEKKFYYAHGGNFVKEVSTANSKYEYSNGITDYNALNFYANYNNSWGKHDVTVMGGFNQESSDYRYAEMSRMNMINEDLPSISQSTGDYFAKDKFERYTVRGLFYRINYSFAGKYLLETNGRYDGSSKYAKHDRWAFFPSASVGWRISEEKFFKSLSKVVDNLKIRASIGALGNQITDGNHSFMSIISGKVLTNYMMDGKIVNGLNIPTLPSMVTWEKVITKDIGLDWSLFKNRLFGSFDFYVRDTKDMVRSVTLPAVLGTSGGKENIADMRTVGWELEMTWKDRIQNVLGSPLDYSLTVGLSDYQAEITKYDNPNGSLASGMYHKGQKLGEIWGYVTDGYIQDDFEAAKMNYLQKFISSKWYPGDIRYKDLNGDGIIDKGKVTLDNPGDQKVIGNSTPRYRFNLQGGIGWHGFDIRAIFEGVMKRDLWTGSDVFWGFSRGIYNSNVTQYHIDNTWTYENPTAYYPRPNTDGNGRSRQVQTKYLQNAAYIRLKDITLSYNIPRKWLSKLKMEQIRVYVSGMNLWEKTGLPPFMTPDIVDQITSEGVSLQSENAGKQYAFMRSYSFGINITF